MHLDGKGDRLSPSTRFSLLFDLPALLQIVTSTEKLDVTGDERGATLGEGKNVIEV